MEIEKLNLQSFNITEEQKVKLQALFPESVTENGKIDFDRLKLTLGGQIDSGKERYGMNWPGKSDCYQNIQQPSIATISPCPEESVNFDTTENLFIEGDNLEVLKLLQKSYLGKVKMIYIDPPYNTGNEFIYPDDYSESLETYLQYTGQIDSEGRKFSTNTDTDGRFHSKWLNMMYPRLFLAKNLLRDDGVIFISIDDNEVHNLRALCNEIFGEENFVANVVWQKRTSPESRLKISSGHEYILMFAKEMSSYDKGINLLQLSDEDKRNYKNPDNDPRGPWVSSDFTAQGYRPNQVYKIITPGGVEYTPPDGRCWKNMESVYLKQLTEGRMWFGNDGKGVPRRKTYLSEKEGKNIWSWWPNNEVGHTQEATQEVKHIFNLEAPMFDYPKPVRLLLRMLQISTSALYSEDRSESDIILDFFAGSGTTAHAVLEINKQDNGNRKFIMVQLPEPCTPESEAFKVGYKTIADISKERIRRVIKKIEENNKGNLEFGKEKTDLGFKVFKLNPSNFKVWNSSVERNSEAVEKQLLEHIEHVNVKSREDAILYEILLKSGFELSTMVTKLDLAGKKVYSVSEGELLICLEKNLTKEVIRAIADKKPARVVCLDEGFHNDDQLKTNAVQTMKDKGVVFRTV